MSSYNRDLIDTVPMADPTELPKNVDLPRDPRPDRNRRRLLQGGLGAAPLLTLVSRPVLGRGGGAGNCHAPSAFVSMPTSEPGKTEFCSGRTPGYWKQTQHFRSWVPPYYPTTMTGLGGHEATRFNSVFTPSPYPPATTLLEVLDMGGGPPNDVGRHIVAALLNAARGWTPVLTVPAVQGIWREYMSRGGAGAGYFEPTAGVKWYHGEIVDYLTSTMPL